MTKKELIRKAAIQIFREKGYSGTTLRDISREAGVSVSTVSYYYGSKENMYKTLFPEDMAQQEPKRREQIENAAIRLFALKGYSDVSIRDIGKEAGVGNDLRLILQTGYDTDALHQSETDTGVAGNALELFTAIFLLGHLLQRWDSNG